MATEKKLLIFSCDMGSKKSIFQNSENNDRLLRDYFHFDPNFDVTHLVVVYSVQS